MQSDTAIKTKPTAPSVSTKGVKASLQPETRPQAIKRRGTTAQPESAVLPLFKLPSRPEVNKPYINPCRSEHLDVPKDLPGTLRGKSRVPARFAVALPSDHESDGVLETDLEGEELDWDDLPKDDNSEANGSNSRASAPPANDDDDELHSEGEEDGDQEEDKEEKDEETDDEDDEEEDEYHPVSLCLCSPCPCAVRYLTDLSMYFRNPRPRPRDRKAKRNRVNLSLTCPAENRILMTHQSSWTMSKALRDRGGLNRMLPSRRKANHRPPSSLHSISFARLKTTTKWLAGGPPPLPAQSKPVLDVKHPRLRQLPHPNATASYMGIYASFINSKWEYQEVLVRLLHLQGTHSGERMGDGLFHLFSKVIPVHGSLGPGTADNASNNLTACERISVLMRSEYDVEYPPEDLMGCMCHVANLAAVAYSDGECK